MRLGKLRPPRTDRRDWPSMKLVTAVLALTASSAVAFGLPQPLKQKKGMIQRVSSKVPSRPAAVAPLALRDASTARAVATSGGEDSSMMETLKTGSFFALWYLFNIGCA